MTSRVAIIMNKAAGGSTTTELKDKIAEAFHTRGREAQLLTARSGEEIWRRAVREGADPVVAGGGDGTIKMRATQACPR